MVARSKLCLKLQGVVAFAHREQRVSLIEQTSVWTVLSEAVGRMASTPLIQNILVWVSVRGHRSCGKKKGMYIVKVKGSWRFDSIRGDTWAHAHH